MSKKGKGGFANRAARRFADMTKVELMSQDEIYDILKSDLKDILEQVTVARRGEGPYPAYIGNAFANVSAALFMYEFAKENVKAEKGKKRIRVKTPLSDDELESLRHIVSEAFKKSERREYEAQALDYDLRQKYLGKAFAKLSPAQYAMVKELPTLTKPERLSLLVNTYGDPTFTVRRVRVLMDKVGGATDGGVRMTDEEKLEFLRELYGPNFDQFVGAAMTVGDSMSSDSDLLLALFKFMDGCKKKRKRRILAYYATAYKRVKGVPFYRMNGSFFGDNERLIKKLVKSDAGFKKAFTPMVMKNAMPVNFRH